MSIPRTFAVEAAVAIVVLANLSTLAGAAPLTLVGSSKKVCQLTGDTDWLTGQPTDAQTKRDTACLPWISASRSTAAAVRSISCSATPVLS
jgi:hypothetical protein